MAASPIPAPQAGGGLISRAAAAAAGGARGAAEDASLQRVAAGIIVSSLPPVPAFASPPTTAASCFGHHGVLAIQAPGYARGSKYAAREDGRGQNEQRRRNRCCLVVCWGVC